MFRSRKKLGNQGQAVVEFALIIIVLLLIIFFIVEASRILWAWVTVQNAARAGARYGLTGEADLSCLNDSPPCDDPRLTSIKNLVTENLTGLRLDPDADFEDGYFHVVQVYGVNALGVFQEDYAGLPGLPLAVRVVYNVPIITPILSGIVENIPVMGQVVVNTWPHPYIHAHPFTYAILYTGATAYGDNGTHRFGYTYMPHEFYRASNSRRSVYRCYRWLRRNPAYHR
jgi:hypothetical protein